MRERSWTLLLALLACSSPAIPPEDPGAHARHTGESFRELSPLVAEQLDGAAAWAVFPRVEDVGAGCAHGGFLFSPTGDARPIVLRCDSSPTAGPAGVTYHLLVILADPRDLELLRTEGIDLDETVYSSPLDDPSLPAEPSGRWAVTTSRGGLLFPARSLRQRIELGPQERGDT